MRFFGVQKVSVLQQYLRLALVVISQFLSFGSLAETSNLPLARLQTTQGSTNIRLVSSSEKFLAYYLDGVERHLGMEGRLGKGEHLGTIAPGPGDSFHIDFSSGGYVSELLPGNTRDLVSLRDSEGRIHFRHQDCDVVQKFKDVLTKWVENRESASKLGDQIALGKCQGLKTGSSDSHFVSLLASQAVPIANGGCDIDVTDLLPAFISRNYWTFRNNANCFNAALVIAGLATEQ